MHGLIDHFTDVFLTWAIKCPHFVEALFCWRYALDMLHWIKSWIALTSFWSIFFDRDDTMDKILDTKKVFLYSACFRFFPTDVAWEIYFFFCSCRVITLAYRFGKMVPFTSIMDAISLWSSAMYNALLRASGLSPENKIEERIPFSLFHARLYLTESYYDWDEKSTAANIFDISCGGGGSISSLYPITVYLLATSDVVCCWISPSDRFLSHDPLSSDYMVDWDNDSMLGIWGGDTNIDEGSFVLHNSW